MSDSRSQHKESKNIRYVEYVDVFSQPNVVPTACVKNHLILFDSFSGNNPFNEIFYEIPNKMYQNLYIYITKGEMTISINNQDTELKSGDSIIIMPENIIRIKNMSTGIKYFMFVIYPKLASEIFNDIGLTYSSARLSLHHFTAQLDNEQMQRVLNIYDEIRHDLITFDYEYKALYIRSMLDILLVENINTHKIEAMPLEGDSNSRQYDVYCKFIALLNKHAVEQRSVQYYANTLGVCGGCKWQHLPYEEQLRHKRTQVCDALERIAKVELPEVNPILGSKKTLCYRNKLEYTFSNKSWLTFEQMRSGEEFPDRNALGFHIPGAFDKVLDIHKCHLQDDLSNRIRLFIRRSRRA